MTNPWIGAKIVRHGRSVVFQMAEVAMPRAVPGNSECDRRAPSIVTGPMLRGVPAILGHRRTAAEVAGPWPEKSLSRGLRRN
jgi:hypothetical protein